MRPLPLKRALDRPEAASLDLDGRPVYRKLLARTLLQTRPAERPQVLRKLLEEGADPEASWLLSRAALQEGAIAEASAALQAAGSYRADHPLESEPSPYVGEAPVHRLPSRRLPGRPGQPARLDAGAGKGPAGTPLSRLTRSRTPTTPR